MQGHATATTGLLSAEGNNSSGIAGVIWRSGLYLYSGYSSGNRPLPLQTGYYLLENQIEADGPRVLTVSVDQKMPATLPVTAREKMIRDLSLDVEFTLNRMPQLLVVVAAGNERYRGTVANYVRDTVTGILRGAILLLRDQPQYRDRIIVVAGTRLGNNFWDIWSANPRLGSNFFTGITDIAAPAQDVTVLDRWTGQTGTGVPTIVRTGTSLSAPLVAGVAGLLLAMDSTISATQLKTYIIGGARRPRVDRLTGQVALPPAVTGAPETVYQLDAYGSLTVLASERPGISLCGNRVWVSNGAVISELNDTTHTTQQLTTLAEAAAYVNVRHGGRRFEVSAVSGDRAFELRRGNWVETQDTATTPYGGAFLSLFQLSHDRDSTVSIAARPGNGFVDLDVNIREFATNTIRTIDTIRVPLPSSGAYVCLDGGCGDSTLTNYTTADWRFAYSPSGDRIFVAVTTTFTQMTGASGFSRCPWADPEAQNPPTCQSVFFHGQVQETAVHSVSVPNGVDSVLWTVPQNQVFWLAAAEDGAQAIGAEGARMQDHVIEPLPGPYPPIGFRINAQPQVITGCTIVYRIAASGGAQRHGVSSDDACQGLEGQGTMAPAPPLVSMPSR
jgi:hypothetical protein